MYTPLPESLVPPVVQPDFQQRPVEQPEMLDDEVVTTEFNTFTNSDGDTVVIPSAIFQKFVDEHGKSLSIPEMKKLSLAPKRSFLRSLFR